jgi:trigger factor
MQFTTRQADRSTVVLDVELPPERVARSIDEAVRHLGRRTRVPGFRPGKVPRAMLERALGVSRSNPEAPDPIYEDAKEHLYERSVIEALRESELDVLEIPREPEWTSFVEGTGASYRVSVPVRPTVKLGDYAHFPFRPEIEEVDDAKIDAVVEQLRDQGASLAPVEGRPAQTGDFGVIGFEGRRDGQPVEGAASERFPLVIGSERLLPGFEDELVGMHEGETKTFTVRFPDDYGESELAGMEVEFTATLRELRERRLPQLDDGFVQSVSSFGNVEDLRRDIGARLERNVRDRARHAFADRIIEYATANATAEIPDLLVDREIDVMLDELKVRLAEQNIDYGEYQRVTERDEPKLREEYRDGAAHRVKVLLTLGAIADAEGVVIPDSAVEAELQRGRRNNPEDSRLVAYLESERGRSYIRSQLRRSQTVEGLIDRWITEHPEFSDVRHVEDQEPATATEHLPDVQVNADADEVPAVPAEDPELVPQSATEVARS